MSESPQSEHIPLGAEEGQHLVWTTEARPERERGIDLEAAITSRLEVHDGAPAEDNQSGGLSEGKFTFYYRKSQFDTTVVSYGEEPGESRHEKKYSLGDFIDGDPDSREAWFIKDCITADVYEKLIKPPAWWLQSGKEIELELVQDIRTAQPTEQLIIGQEGQGIRFYNFGQPMAAEKIEDCRRFVDTMTQFLGDRTYDFVEDVIIADIDRAKNDASGRVNPAMPHTIFLDAGLLEVGELYEDGAEGDISRFLASLIHEGGHTLHGTDDESEPGGLDSFAKEIGWDMSAMKRDRFPKDLRPYGPSVAYEVKTQDGSLSMTREEFDNRYGMLEPAQRPEYTLSGSPTVYGQKNPYESYAEVTLSAMAGRLVAEHMPEVRDAWLSNVQHRILKPGETTEDRPIATPINRAPIVVDRRTGDEILYPRTRLPEKIVVQAIVVGDDDPRAFHRKW